MSGTSPESLIFFVRNKPATDANKQILAAITVFGSDHIDWSAKAF
jgi:hypothetical protein